MKEVDVNVCVLSSLSHSQSRSHSSTGRLSVRISVDTMRFPFSVLSAQQVAVSAGQIVVLIVLPAGLRVNTASAKVALLEECFAMTASASTADAPDSQATDADSLMETIAALSCNHCAAPLTRHAAFSLPPAALPSEHWHELLDCWACHQEDYTPLLTAATKNNKSFVFAARRHRLLVARSHLLVHEDDLSADALHMTHTPISDEHEVQLIPLQQTPPYG
ncbi:hypothetical protein HK100_001007 [Physocladia obscura]|uniref:Uncharacterized protein n=1 Tax=Physocladia obscura TaxID=109957 RepID=A0AAD5T0B5_9FUNG|nr:hypothetical protein HK100_001007 [Physocladia obscura]